MTTDADTDRGGIAASAWLTAVLRPAGTLDAAAVGRLTAALMTLVSCSDMIVVDLTAARVLCPGRLSAALRAPARRLGGPGRCLLLVGAGPDLVAALERAHVQAATIPAQAEPGAVERSMVAGVSSRPGLRARTTVGRITSTTRTSASRMGVSVDP